MKYYILLAAAMVLHGAANAQQTYTMQDLVAIQKEGNYSCVILNGGMPQTFTQRGVADLYDLLKTQPSLLNGASMVDKVVGKGAASLMIIGGIKRLHTGIICTPALTMLRAAGIEVTFDLEVDHILNIPRNGWCPLELRCKDAQTALDALPIIEAFVTEIRQQQKT
jgi:iron complex outermembrane receptor protein